MRKRKSSRKRSAKTGLPPGALIHVGEAHTQPVGITVMAYDEANLQEQTAASIQACFPLPPAPAVTWINVDGIHQADVLEQFGDRLNLHPLVLEDIMNTDQRPKLEDFDDYAFFVLKMFQYEDQDAKIKVEQVSLVLGPNYVVSFLEDPGDVFDPVRGHLRNSRGRIRKARADYLAYALLDAIVDHYFVVLERVGEKIELLEDELVATPTPETLQAIHDLKRDMIVLRKSVWPLREVIGSLERGDVSLVGESIVPYLRDIYDHTVQVIDTIETFRDMLSGMLDIYLSSVSNRMNEVMKVLTVITTIFMPLTLIVGLYGMNFHYMPELEWPWGYPTILAIMVAIATGMLIYFRRKKWL